MLKYLFTCLSFLCGITSGLSTHSIQNQAILIDRISYCTSVQLVTRHYPSDQEFVGVFDPVSKKSTQVVVLIDHDKEHILVGFRGTLNTVQQWTSNMDTVKSRWLNGKGKVHAGFKKRFAEIYQPTVDLLKKARSIVPDGDIIMSGHSMGGAVATLMASALKHEQSSILHPDWVYTFGSPRVGDKTFAQFVDSQYGNRLVRVMNEWDMVTDMPPKGFRFHHTGLLYFCKTGTETCQIKSRLSENPGGALTVFKRVVETAKNVKKCHLTYVGLPIGTNRFAC